MKISEFIKDLQKFQADHGDVEIDAEYFCDVCKDYHQGEGMEIELMEQTKARFLVIECGVGY